MNYKVTEIRLREDIDEEHVELTLERIPPNDINLERGIRRPQLPQPVLLGSSGSVSVDTDSVGELERELEIHPEPESEDEEMAMRYVKGLKKYMPELFNTIKEIKSIAPPPPLISMTPPTPIRLNYVICMDEEEYAEKKILVGDVVSIEVNKKLSEEK